MIRYSFAERKSSLKLSRPLLKMHGLGNDFIVFDTLNQSVMPMPELCRRLVDRRCGVGRERS